MQKVISFGEILMRLSPPGNLRFDQATSFNAVYGGGEFNAIASLANFGLKTEFVTAVPENALGDCVINTIRSVNVGCENILRQGDRLGLYFIEMGASVRSSNVIYDRAESSIAQIGTNNFDWAKIFKGATWFHWSGVTPAISQEAAGACLEAVKKASEMGLKISTDLNYRSKLWNYGKEPYDVMPELLQYSNVIIGDIDTARFMLKKDKIAPDYKNKDEVKQAFLELMEFLPNLDSIGMVFRESVNASHERIGGLLYNNNKLYSEKIRDVIPIVDRVGSGDAFMAGLLYGLLEFDENFQKTIEFATAACILKHSIFGDVNRVSKEEVINFIDNDGAAKVKR
ncbi:sugar kinase [Antarcticibacterium sp. 1MA-6-2]|uniref:sugar kinase n=1 Tax=Antarcticibacterium sp. 1MA-6-2 TaxID=2908210 RepID=UPI001F2F3910|nr:sugar kinase [Antarcticibacterium sp. 1MA-6-2]UJH92665.1 sugar kinase [Antarcticibacterium sp. 1MA-6-2]